MTRKTQKIRHGLKRIDTEKKEGEEVEPAGEKPVDHTASPRITKLHRAAWFQLNSVMPPIQHSSKLFTCEKDGCDS